MSNKKISALTSATTPLAGSETLPIVQSSATTQVSVSNLTAGRAVSASSLSASTGNVEVASTSGYLRVNGQFGGSANGNILVNIGTGQNLILAETASNIYTVGYGAAGGVPTKITDFEVSTKDTRSYGNFVPNTAAKGINFTANTPSAGKTSQLLNWYEEGTWTPTPHSLTTTGSPTYSGTFTRIGRMVFFQLIISANGGTTASTADTTYFSGLPYSSSNYWACPAVDSSITGNLGSGQAGAGGNVFPPTWAATAHTIVVSGMYGV
jgi:hypothetical protein